MYVAGTAKPFAQRLINVTHEALMRGIAAVKPGKTFGDIGHAIQSFVESQRMSVVRDFCGHGLGRVFHSPPNVLHYGRPGSGPVLEEGKIVLQGTPTEVFAQYEVLLGLGLDVPAAARLATLPAGHGQGYHDCFDLFVADAHAAMRGVGDIFGRGL
jgi:hypothetical protein